METKEELLKELDTIKKWEDEQGGLWFWDRIGRLPFKILDKITPAFIHKKMGSLLDEIGGYIQSGGRYLISKERLFSRIEQSTGKPLTSLSDIHSLPIKSLDKVTSELVGQRKKLAAFQGASTGIGGMFTLALDIPAILAISLKTLQEIAIIYGYDPNEKSERIFIVKCLQFSSADIVGKRAILNSLKEHSSPSDDASGEMMSQLQGWREVVYTYRDAFGWKKFFQMVPVAGLVFGAITNRSMIKDLAETGTMLYKKRRILERLENMD
ncbi:EcsC family protein [Peribacillus deserti]|uniref:EcsC family protein n=1 Tax=Peribacillus deserti TaxID=673318 RepID=UPI0026CFDF68